MFGGGCEGGEGGGGGGGGVLARRGLRRGAATRAFTLAELALALQRPAGDYVYAEPGGAEGAGGADGEGGEGGEGGGLWSRAGAAALCARARLAPAAAAAAAAASLGAERRGAELRLRLRLAADVPPLHEVLLWPDAAALAALGVPFLAPLNISGSTSYICHKCRMEFEYPNPLKIHLFMGCREYTHVDFWRRCLTKFSEIAAEPSHLSHLSHLALERTACPPRASVSSGGVSAASVSCGGVSPAALEALAAAWGRSRDGHVCVYCGKLYSRKYGLKIHIRTHTGYKPLRCRHCLRAFGDPSNLNKHVRLHAQPRGSCGAPGAHGAAHACGQCGVRLARRRDLERHVRARHASPPPPPPPDPRASTLL